MSKLFFIDEMKPLLHQYRDGEVSISKLTELLNEKVESVSEPIKEREQEELFTIEDLRKAWGDGWRQNTNDRYDDSGKTFKDFLATIKGAQSPQPYKELSEDPFGYIFENKFYKSLDELKGQTFFEGNETVAVYTKNIK